MKNKNLHLAIMLLLAGNIPTFTFQASAQTSPNGKVRAGYVASKGLVVSYCKDGIWQDVMSMPTECSVSSAPRKATVTYTMLSGKKKQCTNAYSSSTYTTPDNSSSIEVRVYNDGVTWCGAHDYYVDFTSSRNDWIMKWADSYEGFFPKNRIAKADERFGYPALFEYDNGIFSLLTESCIGKDNAATSMYSTGDRTFALRPDGKENGGWQTLIVGSLSDIVTSTLVTDNSLPQARPSDIGCKDRDWSWVEPGVASWIYWANNHGSNNMDIIREYIDLAVKLRLPYVLIDAEWDEMNKLASNKGKTIEDAVKEAVDKGIKPIIWYNSSVGWINGAPGPKFRLNKPEDREKEFAWCEKIGVKGVKIDFFSGDTNLNMKYMIELLECAARHHLLVNFHGATIPRGWQRTYPNLISTEGVYGAEWYNNVPTFTDKAATHNAMLPFTRNVVGPMDYTPCAFSDSQHPHITTHAHELALTVLYESGIQHIADRPVSLLAQPEEVKEFFGNLPTAWDETRLLSGYPGEYVVIARRSGNVWYVAGINGSDYSRNMGNLNLSQLKGLGNAYTIFEDSGNSKSPWKITKTNNASITTCLPRGGFVMKISK